MKQVTIAALATFFITTSASRGENITYNFLPYDAVHPGISFSGSITTNGHIGTLAASDIVGWQFTLARDGHSYAFSSTDRNTRISVDGPLTADFARILLPSGGQLFLDTLNNPVGVLSYDRFTFLNRGF